ncbi:MAG: caspase family protein [Pseudomonadales bacterium]
MKRSLAASLFDLAPASYLKFSLGVAVATLPGALGAQDTAIPDAAAVADLHVVDCLLPGQIRRLGNRTYLTPRRPTQTTASDCQIRGGEYVAFDRADYQTALKVWMESANAGDANAQTMVGEIYEKGLGTTPNYAAAHTWYAKAAKQGSTRAQFALGALYEQGLGVEPDSLAALNWYRQAWGIKEDDLIFESAARREASRQREALEATISGKSAQIEVLKKQLLNLQSKLQGDNNAAAEISTLQALVADLEQQRSASTQTLSALPTAKTREPAFAKQAKEFKGKAKKRMFKKLRAGAYYALLIGNERYDNIENLATPLNDIERAAKVLREKYGFEVKVVPDGNNIAVMEAINDLNNVLDEQDNLLLFYAGHGTRLQAGEAEVGYWLPSNADAPPRDTYWVSNEFITGHLARLKARRVLLVADSCYAGLLSSEPSFMLMGDVEAQYADPDFLKFKFEKRSRLLLASGGDRPVLDEGSQGHSVFANAFIEELERNDGLLSGPQLFLRIRDRVARSARALDFEQTPELKVIKSAGHEVGDFFFLPRSAS